MAGERNEQYPDWMMGALARQDLPQQGIDPAPTDQVPMGSLASDQNNQTASPLRITVRPRSFQDYLDDSPSGQQSADQLIPPPRFGFDDPANPVNQTIGQKAHELLDLGATPRDLLRGDPRYQVTPEVPGQWSERDQYRQDQLNDEVALRGATLGFHMTGSGAMGAPFREYGLGAGGGRMIAPQPRPVMGGVAAQPSAMQPSAMDTLRDAAFTASQDYTKSQLPPPLPFMERIWRNYAKHMTPDELLTSEPLWSGAQRLAENSSMNESQAFAHIANNMFQRMGVDRYLTPESANAIMGEQRGAGMLEDLLRKPPSEAIQRDAMVRGRSGRPIQTAPLPLGTEDAILQQGYNRALGLEPSPGPQPPFMQAAARKGAVMGDLARLKAGGEEGAPPMGATMASQPTTLFDYSKIRDVPDVRQFDLPRYDPARGVSERVQDLVKNKRVERQMLDYLEKGKGINAETFYYNEPLREAFRSELGKDQGVAGFQRYMDYVAATSPRSSVEENARNASYYYMLEKQGLPIPPKGGVNPQPYGHLAQNLHRLNAEKIRSGQGFDIKDNPKPLSFSQNLQGNFAPATIDAHALKLPAMLAKNPDFLATSIKLEKGVPSIYPSRMFESGDLTMKEALKRPVYWAAKPNPNEYAAMEQYYKRLAQEVGMAPAQGQAAAWGGGGSVTGLESVAGDPFMRSVENRALITARNRGITPAEALSRMMRGKEGLLGLGAAATMGSLARQNDYQQ